MCCHPLAYRLQHDRVVLGSSEVARVNDVERRHRVEMMDYNLADRRSMFSFSSSRTWTRLKMFRISFVCRNSCSWISHPNRHHLTTETLTLSPKPLENLPILLSPKFEREDMAFHPAPFLESYRTDHKRNQLDSQ